MKFPRLPRHLDRRIKLSQKDVREIKNLIRKRILKKDIAKKFKISLVTLRYYLLTPLEKKKLNAHQWELRRARDLTEKGRTKRRIRQSKSVKRKYKLVPQSRNYAREIAKKHR